MTKSRAGLFVRGLGKSIAYASVEDACCSEALRAKPDLGIQKPGWRQRSRLGNMMIVAASFPFDERHACGLNGSCGSQCETTFATRQSWAHSFMGAASSRMERFREQSADLKICTAVGLPEVRGQRWLRCVVGCG